MPRVVSPYLANPPGLNPLRDVIESEIAFSAALLREFRAIAFARELIAAGRMANIATSARHGADANRSVRCCQIERMDD